MSPSSSIYRQSLTIARPSCNFDVRSLNGNFVRHTNTTIKSVFRYFVGYLRLKFDYISSENEDVKIRFVLRQEKGHHVRSIQFTRDLILSASFAIAESKRNPRGLAVSLPAENLSEDSYQIRAIRQPRVALPFDQSLITFTCSCIILLRLPTLLSARKRANSCVRASATRRARECYIYKYRAFSSASTNANARDVVSVDMRVRARRMDERA